MVLMSKLFTFFFLRSGRDASRVRAALMMTGTSVPGLRLQYISQTTRLTDFVEMKADGE